MAFCDSMGASPGNLVAVLGRLIAELPRPALPLRLVITCPACGKQHVDEGEWATRLHRTHQCQDHGCLHEWRPSTLYTVGVASLALEV